MAISSPLLETSASRARTASASTSPAAPTWPLRGQRGGARSSRSAADEDANIIFGAVIDERIGDEVSITVIATGFDSTKRREYTTATADSSVRAGRDNRDFLRELERERDRERQRMEKLGVPDQSSERPFEVSTPAPAAAPASALRRPTYDEVDLDIPAFLRRSR